MELSGRGQYLHFNCSPPHLGIERSNPTYVPCGSGSSARTGKKLWRKCECEMAQRYSPEWEKNCGSAQRVERRNRRDSPCNSGDRGESEHGTRSVSSRFTLSSDLGPHRNRATRGSRSVCAHPVQ